MNTIATALPIGTPDATTLLLDAPDDQVIRCRQAWRDIAAGNWADAEWWLRQAVRDAGGTAWSDRAGRLADFCQARIAQ